MSRSKASTVEPGDLVRILPWADGDGSFARDSLAQVTRHSTLSYGLVDAIVVEIVGGPTLAMKELGFHQLSLYDDEWEPA